MQLASSTTSTAGLFAPILDAATNIVTVRRPLPANVAEAMQSAARADEFAHEARIDVGAPDVEAFVAPVRDGLARRYLARDIVDLVQAFGAVMNRRHLHARLALVTGDACRKLHSDFVSIRLLCTYAGPGTEWVANEDVNRANLARVDVDMQTANRSVLRRADAVRHCSPGEVILLKGDAYEGNAGQGAIHRSPPIEASGARRLLLKIDEHPCGC